MSWIFFKFADTMLDMSIQSNNQINSNNSCFPSQINNPAKKLLFVVAIIVALGSVAAFIAGMSLPIASEPLTLSLLIGGGVAFFLSGTLIERLKSPTSPLCGSHIENSVPVYDPSTYVSPQPQPQSNTSYFWSRFNLLSSSYQLRNLCSGCSRPEIRLNNLASQRRLLDDWISRLSQVRGYSDSMARVIYDAIVLAEEDEEYRDVFIGCLLEATSSCGDRVALSILHIGLNLRIKNAVDQRDLRSTAALLLRGRMTLNILEDEARQKVFSSPGCDVIEVYLGYPVQLKDRLRIPIDISGMMYSSNLTPIDLSLAAERVEAALADQMRCAEFLAGNDSWQHALVNHDRYQQLVAVRDAASEEASSNEDYVRIDDEFKQAVAELTFEFIG